MALSPHRKRMRQATQETLNLVAVLLRVPEPLLVRIIGKVVVVASDDLAAEGAIR